MADEQQGRTTRQRQPSGERRENGSRRADPAEIVAVAAQQLAALISHPVTGVTGVTRTEHGWRVELEVVELERVPDTMTILATYEIRLDEHGGLRGIRRTHRYTRSQVGES